MADVSDSTSGIKVKAYDSTTLGNLAKSGPLVGHYNKGKSVYDSLTSWPNDPDVEDLSLHAGGIIADTAGFIQGCASEAMSIASDPLGWLISQGLNFLLNIVQPLQDALHAVTGDGPALSKAAGNFASIGQGLEAMSEDFVRVADEALKEWHGEAADAAKVALAKFAKGVSGVSAKSGNISEMLAMSSMLMTVIEEVLKAIITELISWLIMIWIPALAAAVPTAGASTAAAGSATAVKGSMTAAKTTQKVSKLQQILSVIKAWFAKFKATLAKTFPEGSRGMKDAFLGADGMHGKKRQILEDSFVKHGRGAAETIARQAGDKALTAGVKAATGVDASKKDDLPRLATGIASRTIKDAKAAKAATTGTEQTDDEIRENFKI